ncbi:polysaccharide deacetylase family protein [Candidatus Omnitrophota bacterium]
MVNKIKHLLGLALFHSGLLFLLDFIFDKKNSGQIICYHSVSSNGYYHKKESPDEYLKANFERQIKFLNKQFKIASLKITTEELRNNKPLKPRTLGIIFDDGYRDNLTLAFPLLKKLNIPATFFITTGFIDNKLIPEFDKIAFIVRNTKKQKLRIEALGTSYLLETDQEKQAAILDIDTKTKELEAKKRSEIINSMSLTLEVLPEKEINDNLCMRREQIVKLNNDLTQIGSHGHTHKKLTKMPLQQAREEITISKIKLEEIIKEPIILFSYPFGEYNKDIQNILIETGYVCGIGKDKGRNFGKNDLLQLRRFFIDSDTTIYDLYCLLSKTIQSLEGFLSSLERKIF